MHSSNIPIFGLVFDEYGEPLGHGALVHMEIYGLLWVLTQFHAINTITIHINSSISQLKAIFVCYVFMCFIHYVRTRENTSKNSRKYTRNTSIYSLHAAKKNNRQSYDTISTHTKHTSFTHGVAACSFQVAPPRRFNW